MQQSKTTIAVMITRSNTALTLAIIAIIATRLRDKLERERERERVRGEHGAKLKYLESPCIHSPLML